MPSLHVIGTVPANDTPSAGFATPVTFLRFQPSVDVQSRGFAETQCDVVIRGGIFENTGFKIGAVNILDPQTGHYSSELPIDPLLLSNPAILTGSDNTMNGLNATAGTVSYDWLPVNNAGTVEAGFGTDSLYFTRLVAGGRLGVGLLGRSVALQVSSAYSSSDGTIENGDHRFQRFGARLQLVGNGGQTDLFAGYQRKEYGWPGMYTGNAAYPEYEDYEVALLIFNHTQKYGDGSSWSFGAYGRKFLDDYELNRDIPGYYRPYEHETRIGGAALEGQHNMDGDLRVDWRVEGQSDDIRSSDLTYADFMSRSYWKGAARLGRQLDVAGGDMLVQLGAAFADTNRDDSGAGPIARVTFNRNLLGGFTSSYVEFSRATEVSGYTAIGSKPGLASFAGNADLGRERADNFEFGSQWSVSRLTMGASVFWRSHEDLVDWTYDSTQPKTFRAASAMDLDVFGVEAYVSWKASESVDLSIGYAFLEEDSDYGGANVDASFYAMNFPRHRGSASVVWRPFEGVELRVDGEAREQAANARRRSGGDALFVNASVGWSPDFLDGFTVSVIADNLTDCDFQEFPGVPVDGRQVAMRIGKIW